MVKSPDTVLAVIAVIKSPSGLKAVIWYPGLPEAQEPPNIVMRHERQVILGSCNDHINFMREARQKAADQGLKVIDFGAVAT